MSEPPGPCEVVRTRGGAWAMLDHATGEVMHPVVGPLVEAEELYVRPSRLRERLGEAQTETLVLLDVGLGAGSNAVAAFQEVQQHSRLTRRLHIVSFENSLAAMRLALSPSHRGAFGLDGEVLTAANRLLSDGRYDNDRCTWELRPGDLPTTLEQVLSVQADLVFWDPFSPRANPDLWTVATFSALHRMCRTGCTVHTYSGATAVRSALLLSGFHVGQGPSTGEKAQTTVASTELSDLAHPLDLRWLERLERSSAAFPRDAPQDAMERVRAMPQFNRAASRTSP